MAGTKRIPQCKGCHRTEEKMPNAAPGIWRIIRLVRGQCRACREHAAEMAAR